MPFTAKTDSKQQGTCRVRVNAARVALSCFEHDLEDVAIQSAFTVPLAGGDSHFVDAATALVNATGRAKEFIRINRQIASAKDNIA